MAFSPDGKTSSPPPDGDGMLRIWDALTGKPIGRPMAPRRPGHGHPLRPDGSSIATASRAACPLPLDRIAPGEPIHSPALIAGRGPRHRLSAPTASVLADRLR